MDAVVAVIFLIINVFNLIVSSWNAYASGFSGEFIKIMQKSRLRGFLKSSYTVGIIFSLVGAIYATALIISSLLFLLNLVSVWVFEFLNNFCFIVFGSLIVGFGIIITINGYVVTYYRRKMGGGKYSDWLINAWNTYAMVRNILVFSRYFKDALRDLSSFVEGSRSRDRDSGYAAVIIILIIATIIASYIIYKAYELGKRRAKMIIRNLFKEEYSEYIKEQVEVVPLVEIVRYERRQ